MKIDLRFVSLLPLLAVVAAACSKSPEPTSTATPAPERPAAESSSARGPGASTGAPKGAELAWDAPSGWESVPNPNAMRKATYKVKRAEGDPEDAELSVSQAGGSVDANIQRWVGQFAKKSDDSPKRAETTVNDIKVTQVEVHGTFAGSGMPGMPAGEPKPSYALLGAIAETPTGGLWFFKLTGPDKTVTAAKADFDKLVNSLRMK
jgi:hypothetical protein